MSWTHKGRLPNGCHADGSAEMRLCRWWWYLGLAGWLEQASWYLSVRLE